VTGEQVHPASIYSGDPDDTIFPLGDQNFAFGVET
jgi:hypothetical protein